MLVVWAADNNDDTAKAADLAGGYPKDFEGPSFSDNTVERVGLRLNRKAATQLPENHAGFWSSMRHS